MKKSVFGLIATVMFGFAGNAQSFEKSVGIIKSSRVEVGNDKMQSALSLIFKSFDTNYKLFSSYSINGIGFTDDGKYNDKISGDGVYTSTKLFKNNFSSIKPDETVIFVGNTFAHLDELKKQVSNGGEISDIKIGCKVRIVYTGTTWLGFSCASGCLELYDCEVSFELSWN